ncbi:hypothetical protein ABKN59_008326 [Abortiporus biennis]
MDVLVCSQQKAFRNTNHGSHIRFSVFSRLSAISYSERPHTVTVHTRTVILYVQGLAGFGPIKNCILRLFFRYIPYWKDRRKKDSMNTRILYFNNRMRYSE